MSVKQHGRRRAEVLVPRSSHDRQLVEQHNFLLTTRKDPQGRAEAARNVPHVDSVHPIVAELLAMVESSRDVVLAAERRAAAAHAEVERLRVRVRELETWLEASAHFDQLEHVQLGRVLALASAEREARRLPWLVSARLVAVALYIALAGLFVWSLLSAHA
jgi:hypothetical protein